LAALIALTIMIIWLATVWLPLKKSLAITHRDINTEPQPLHARGSLVFIFVAAGFQLRSLRNGPQRPTEFSFWPRKKLVAEPGGGKPHASGACGSPYSPSLAPVRHQSVCSEPQNRIYELLDLDLVLLLGF
jgi:hypothetical protein